MSLVNHQFRLAARPVGMPKRSDWKSTEEPVRDLNPGEVAGREVFRRFETDSDARGGPRSDDVAG